MSNPAWLRLPPASAASRGSPGHFSRYTVSVELSPAQAMRPPAPPRYRRLLLERLGATAWIPTAARMILRNIERRPLRSGPAAVGVGAQT